MAEPKREIKICLLCDNRIYSWQKELNLKTIKGTPFIVHKRCWENR